MRGVDKISSGARPMAARTGACEGRAVPNFPFLLSILAAGLLLSDPAQAARIRAVDGDTLALGRERVRVVGLDAPELHGRCERETVLARAAQRRMAQLVAGGVTLRPHGRDRFGRLLAVVHDRRGRDVARVMVRQGLARPYDGRGRRGGWC